MVSPGLFISPCDGDGERLSGRVQQVEDAPQRYPDPLGPVVELVLELVERLVQHKEVQQRVALGIGARDEDCPACGRVIRAQER